VSESSTVRRRIATRAATLAVAATPIAALLAVSPPVPTPAGASVPGSFAATASSAVPGSSQVLVLGRVTVKQTSRFAVLRVSHGRASSSTLPAGDQPAAITAGSSSTAWIGGYTINVSNASAPAKPLIERSKGRGWSKAKLPKLFSGSAVTAMSASSSTNAWAVGYLNSSDNTINEALHWNGKSWTAFNTGLAADTQLSAVSTSGPTNAWAIGGNQLLHWNGKAWSVSNTALGGSITSLATSSANRAWGVGTVSGPSGRPEAYSMFYNGKKWSTVKMPKTYTSGLLQVSLHGSSAWAVGTIGTRTSSRPYVLHTAGDKWKKVPVSSIGTGGGLSTVAAQSASSALAFGTYGTGKTCLTFRSHPLFLTLHPTSSRRTSEFRLGTARLRMAPSIPAC
jgi:hypothetical protein